MWCCCKVLDETENTFPALIRSINWSQDAHSAFSNLYEITIPLNQNIRIQHMTKSDFFLDIKPLPNGCMTLSFAGNDTIIRDAYDVTSAIKRMEADPFRYPDVGLLLVGLVELFSV